MKRVEAFLLLLTACFLQRIDFFGTSLGMFAVVLLFMLAGSRVMRERKFRIREIGPLYSYPVFVFAFLFPPYLSLSNLTADAYIPFIAPIAIWIYLMIQGSPSNDDFTYRPILWVVLFFLGYALIKDFSVMFESSDQTLKKNFGFANPNYTGFLINSLTAIYLTGAKLKKLTDWPFLFTSTVLTILTLSKTAYILQAILLCVYLGRNIAFMTPVIFGIITILISANFMPEADLAVRIKEFLNGDIDGAISHRISLIRAAWEIFKDNPVLGIGYGNYTKYAFFIYDSPFPVKTHNIILTILSERGILGTLILGASQMTLCGYMKNKWTPNLFLLYLMYWAYSLTHAIGETLIIFPIFIYFFDERFREYTKTPLQNPEKQISPNEMTTSNAI